MFGGGRGIVMILIFTPNPFIFGWVITSHKGGAKTLTLPTKRNKKQNEEQKAKYQLPPQAH